MNSKGTSYLLWLAIFLGLGGLHRLYNGRVFTGFLWLLTGGGFGIGQLIDLLLIPDMVNSYNLKYRALHSGPDAACQPAISRPVTTTPHPEQLMVSLLYAAQKRGGQISVTQGVVDTGASFVEVEKTLMEIAKKGYASIQNDAKSGAVVYVFPEL